MHKTDLLPALLEETFDPAPFLADDAWAMEEKLNGRRMILTKFGNVVRAYSRNGLEYLAPLAVVKCAQQYPFDFVLDGELVGEVFIMFDLPLMDCSNEERTDWFGCNVFSMVDRATGALAKFALFDRIKSEGGEGVVFKRLDGLYCPGARNYGFKFKFYLTETVHVESVDILKSSMAISRFGKPCGRVSFPFNQPWPKVGELWEVRYDELSATGKLMRPRLLIRRDDLETVLT